VIKPILDFTGKPIQEAIWYDRSRSIGAFGGYNAGKSFVMAAKIHTYLEIFAGSKAIIGRKTYPAMKRSIIPDFLEKIVAPRNGGTYDKPGLVTKSWNASELTLKYNNGSELWFVTYDDVKKVRGPNIAFAGISQAEEVSYEIFLELLGRIRQWQPDSIEAFKDKYSEALQRDMGYVPLPFNQIICEGNPAPNWVKKEFRENKGNNNSSYDIPTKENIRYHAEGWLDQIRRTYTDEMYSRYIDGSWDHFGGQIYKDFEFPGIHSVDYFEIPSHWPRIIGWDHGRVNPTAVEIAAVDEMGNLVFYKEHYRGDTIVSDHAKAFKQLSEHDFFPMSDNGKFLVVMDYSVKGTYGGDGKSIWDNYIEQGIYGLDAEKNVHAGIIMCQEYLRPDPTRAFPSWHARKGQLGSPKVFIVEGGCPNLVNELQLYQWEPIKEGSEKNQTEMPKKWNDHACDSFRYICMYIGKKKAQWIKPPMTDEQVGREADARVAKHAFTQAEIAAYSDDET
jgi:hypothetical protein